MGESARNGETPAGTAQLVRTARMGSGDSYAELVRRYRRTMVTVARSMVGDQESAEDIVQESLLVAFRSLGRLRDPCKFGNWLYAIVRHRALRHLRQLKRAPILAPSPSETQWIGQPASRDDPVQRFERGELTEAVRDALAGLPADNRIAIELRYWNGLGMNEMAGLLSVPVSTIKWRLFAAKRAIGRAMEGAYDDKG